MYKNLVAKHFVQSPMALNKIIIGNLSETKQQDLLLVWCEMVEANQSPEDPNPTPWTDAMVTHAERLYNAGHCKDSLKFAYWWMTGDFDLTGVKGSKKDLVEWFLTNRIHPFSHLLLRSLALYECAAQDKLSDPDGPDPVLREFTVALVERSTPSPATVQEPARLAPATPAPVVVQFRPMRDATRTLPTPTRAPAAPVVGPSSRIPPTGVCLLY
jgi:hypothetical protein